MVVSPHKIMLKSPNGRYDEGLASGAITPGHLLEQTSADQVRGLNTYKKHSVASGPTERMFSIEDSLQGLTIDDDYADGSIVRFWHALPGDEVYALLSDGENVTSGNHLESNGDGTLRKASGTFLEVGHVGVALEDVDLTTGTATTDGRIRTRIV